jgi:hypothetical protein
VSIDPLGGVLRNPRARGLRIERVKIAQVSPLQITLASGVTVNGLAVAGLTYSAPGNGVAFLAEGQIPLVLPTL